MCPLIANGYLDIHFKEEAILLGCVGSLKDKVAACQVISWSDILSRKPLSYFNFKAFPLRTAIEMQRCSIVVIGSA